MNDEYIDMVFFTIKVIVTIFIDSNTLLKNYVCQQRIDVLLNIYCGAFWKNNLKFFNLY